MSKRINYVVLEYTDDSFKTVLHTSEGSLWWKKETEETIYRGADRKAAYAAVEAHVRSRRPKEVKRAAHYDRRGGLDIGGW